MYPYLLAYLTTGLAPSPSLIFQVSNFLRSVNPMDLWGMPASGLVEYSKYTYRSLYLMYPYTNPTSNTIPPTIEHVITNQCGPDDSSSAAAACRNFICCCINYYINYSSTYEDYPEVLELSICRQITIYYSWEDSSTRSCWLVEQTAYLDFIESKRLSLHLESINWAEHTQGGGIPHWDV